MLSILTTICKVPIRQMTSNKVVKLRDNMIRMKRAGAKIKKARRDARLTQEQLARQIGVARVTVSNWERNQHEVEPLNAVELVKALKSLKLEDILDDEQIRTLGGV